MLLFHSFYMLTTTAGALLHSLGELSERKRDDFEE